MRAAALLLALGALGGCRTEVRPIVKAEASPARLAERPAECVVHDYATAFDVPAGSVNLGWIAVPREGTDDATVEKLRAAVCAKGGTALSQARWNRAAGASLADPPVELEANAWVEP